MVAVYCTNNSTLAHVLKWSNSGLGIAWKLLYSTHQRVVQSRAWSALHTYIICVGGTVWNWTDQHTEALNRAKWTVKQAQALGTLDTSKPIKLSIYETPDGFYGLRYIRPPLDLSHSYGRGQRNVKAWKTTVCHLCSPSCHRVHHQRSRIQGCDHLWMATANDQGPQIRGNSGGTHYEMGWIPSTIRNTHCTSRLRTSTVPGTSHLCSKKGWNARKHTFTPFTYTRRHLPTPESASYTDGSGKWNLPEWRDVTYHPGTEALIDKGQGHSS